MSQKYTSDAIRHLNQKRRELLYYMAIKQYTPKQIAELLGQTERNVRKCEAVMLKHLRADLLKGIRNKFSRGHTLLKSKKSFLERYNFSEKGLS